MSFPGNGNQDVYPWEAKEVGVAVRAALGAIDFIQMRKREVQTGSQAFDPFPKVAFWERRQFVKEWLNDGRVEENHQDLEGEPGCECFSPMVKNFRTRKTYKNAIKNGMKLSPAHLKIFKKAARNGPPIANPTNQYLSVSVMNTRGVVLLNPCFSSRTKV